MGTGNGKSSDNLKTIRANWVELEYRAYCATNDEVGVSRIRIKKTKNQKGKNLSIEQDIFSMRINA